MVQVYILNALFHNGSANIQFDHMQDWFWVINTVRAVLTNYKHIYTQLLGKIYSDWSVCSQIFLFYEH